VFGLDPGEVEYLACRTKAVVGPERWRARFVRKRKCVEEVDESVRLLEFDCLAVDKIHHLVARRMDAGLESAE